MIARPDRARERWSLPAEAEYSPHWPGAMSLGRPPAQPLGDGEGGQLNLSVVVSTAYVATVRAEGRV